ncbi:phage terminase small subunit P27 family [uncultured Lactobacillus sp.]|uniref:phage terminase small subunit P27 family n=1 Tax=uncultured Lactobacillus sp. TaxID=153152 RepID=UPI0025EA6856|nr:phage terminase small subunit P27 family [uncultured Lactobacillus sp.]
MTKVDLTVSKVPETSPKWLGKYGKVLYPKLAAYLNKNAKIIRADEYLVQEYCSTYDIYRIAYGDIQEHGIQQAVYKTAVSPVDGSVVSKDFSGYRKNPAYQMMSDSLSKMNQIGRELGLSPKARSQMMELNSPSEKGKKSVTDQMKEFFSDENRFNANS